MSESGQVLSEAIAMESEAAEGIDAAQAEQQSGRPTLSIDLLRQAIEKERASLDLLEQSVETLRMSFEQRRQALDQEAEILDQLMSEINERS